MTRYGCNQTISIDAAKLIKQNRQPWWLWHSTHLQLVEFLVFGAERFLQLFLACSELSHQVLTALKLLPQGGCLLRPHMVLLKLPFQFFSLCCGDTAAVLQFHLQHRNLQMRHTAVVQLPSQSFHVLGGYSILLELSPQLLHLLCRGAAAR